MYRYIYIFYALGYSYINISEKTEKRKHVDDNDDGIF